MDAVEKVWRAVERGLEPRSRGDMGVPAALLVACSGGPDSLTLLDALAALAEPLALTLFVACVDHGLRAEAADEARGVVRAAEARGVSAVVLRVEVERPTMAAARRARYQALIAHARKVGATAIAVGHTATDQAETLLDRLVRGAGTRGLSAMARVREAAPGVQLIRPLLDLTAVDIEAYVVARGLEVVRDPTNRDARFRRSRLRHQVLPLLRHERADLDRSLVALCDRLRADADALDAEAARAHAAITRDAAPRDAALLAPGGGSHFELEACAPGASRGAIDVRALNDLPHAIAARVVARAAGVPLESVHVEAILALCRTLDGTRTLDLPGRVVAERRYDRLRFGPRIADPGDVEVAVGGPGRYRFLRVEVRIDPRGWERLGGGPLWLRNLRPGDRGDFGKLKDHFVDHKVPRPARRWLPLLVRRYTLQGTAMEKVLWVPVGLGSTGVVCNNVVGSVEALAEPGHQTE